MAQPNKIGVKKGLGVGFEEEVNIALERIKHEWIIMLFQDLLKSDQNLFNMADTDKSF